LEKPLKLLPLLRLILSIQTNCVMKTVKQTLIFLLTTLLISSCVKQAVTSNSDAGAKVDMYGEQSNSRNNTGSTVVVEDAVQNATLDNYLQRVAGVNVTGTGANASITIRGVGSFISSNEPLFLVNGQAISGYSSAFGLCNANNIKSVAVLKDAASCALYGSRGANGVISITLKK
jgi:TonB-dependent SusC/RagA subfamily outer membrane receptor